MPLLNLVSNPQKSPTSPKPRTGHWAILGQLGAPSRQRGRISAGGAVRGMAGLFALMLGVVFLMTGCDNVPAGHVGVQVEKYGDDRGVNVEVKSPGRYFNGPNVDMFLFPTFTQSHVWDSNKVDESFTFQTIEGLSVNTDLGISYFIAPENAAKVFQKYRKGVEEITSIYLRAMVRDALNIAGASVAVEDAYGKGKAALQQAVEDDVRRRAAEVGVTVEKVYFVNQMRLPEAVMRSINGKIAATQIAQQKENELRAAEADAAKAIALARGEAEAARIRGEALRANPQILEQMAIEKWDGKLPQVLGNKATPFINLKDHSK